MRRDKSDLKVVRSRDQKTFSVTMTFVVTFPNEECFERQRAMELVCAILSSAVEESPRRVEMLAKLQAAMGASAGVA